MRPWSSSWNNLPMIEGWSSMFGFPLWDAWPCTTFIPHVDRGRLTFALHCVGQKLQYLLWIITKFHFPNLSRFLTIEQCKTISNLIRHPKCGGGIPAFSDRPALLVDDMSPFLMQLVWVVFRYLKLVDFTRSPTSVDVEICWNPSSQTWTEDFTHGNGKKKTHGFLEMFPWNYGGSWFQPGYVFCLAWTLCVGPLGVSLQALHTWLQARLEDSNRCGSLPPM